MTALQQTIVMAFGGLIAAAGLILLFLRKETGQNRIKVLGWEFELSTPALVVIVAGCAIFVLPFFIGQQTENGSFPGDKITGGGPQVDPNKPTGGTPIGGKGSPDTASTQEEESNDHISQANPVSLGTTIRGVLKSKDTDFYRLILPGGFEDNVRIICRELVTSSSSSTDIFNIRVTVYNSVEEKVKSGHCGDSSPATFAFFAEANSTYYVKVEWDFFKKPNLTYELVVRKDEK